jgi:hypothetical protein
LISLGAARVLMVESFTDTHLVTKIVFILSKKITS